VPIDVLLFPPLLFSSLLFSDGWLMVDGWLMMMMEPLNATLE
jgi:hypothetical protein